MSNTKALQTLRTHINQHIVGQDKLVERMLIALLADGHILVEGPPGLAKTKAINALSQGVEADFHRVQFTPDLLPADLTGTDIYRPETGIFEFQKGPLFHNLILADEINRSPAKVQSALLEAMAERQITIGGHTYPLPDLFLVMATQNPLEQEGTYPLPEAQLDRFLMHINLDYPEAKYEKQILNLVRNEANNIPLTPIAKLTKKDLFIARQSALAVYMSDELEDYLLEIILATRNPKAYSKDLSRWIQYGASPRASIALDRCVRVKAYLSDNEFVSPADIQELAYDVLRHRLILSYEAEAEGITPDKVIEELIRQIAVP